MDVSQYLEIFIDESSEHLQCLSDCIMTLEKEPDNKDTINEVFRAAHSLKGMAGTMGFKRMQHLTHDMENVFQEVRSDKISLNTMPAIGGLRPCANITYDSLSKCGFDEVVCVVLTGMGADGTNGILSLGHHKPIHVISQNAETCIVYGMPKAIEESGVVDEVVPLEKVAETIVKNVGVK